jgi:anti-sigma regulatory factor (Ser/Thr protein kinase)
MATTSPKIGQGVRIFGLALEATDDAPKRARDAVQSAWTERGLEDEYLARLVVSELVTNSVRASEPHQKIKVVGYLADDVAALEVWDESAEELPELEGVEMPDCTSENGRGLFAVVNFAESVEVFPSPGGQGKVVRAELGVSGA